MGLRTPLHRSAHSASPSSPPAACTLIYRPSHGPHRPELRLLRPSTPRIICITRMQPANYPQPTLAAHHDIHYYMVQKISCKRRGGQSTTPWVATQRHGVRPHSHRLLRRHKPIDVARLPLWNSCHTDASQPLVILLDRTAGDNVLEGCHIARTHKIPQYRMVTP